MVYLVKMVVKACAPRKLCTCLQHESIAGGARQGLVLAAASSGVVMVLQPKPAVATRCHPEWHSDTNYYPGTPGATLALSEVSM